MSSPVLYLIRFMRSHGPHAVRHLLDSLNEGQSKREIARSFNATTQSIRRVVDSVTEKKYILKQELCDFLDEELQRQTKAHQEIKRERKSVLRLAQGNDCNEEQGRP